MLRRAKSANQATGITVAAALHRTNQKRRPFARPLTLGLGLRRGNTVGNGLIFDWQPIAKQRATNTLVAVGRAPLKAGRVSVCGNFSPVRID